MPVPVQALLPAQAAGDVPRVTALGAELHSYHLGHPNNQNVAPERGLFIRL